MQIKIPCCYVVQWACVKFCIVFDSFYGDPSEDGNSTNDGNSSYDGDESCAANSHKNMNASTFNFMNI